MIVSRLELMPVRLQRFKVADSIITRSRLKHVGERQRCQRRIAPRASSPDDEPVTIREAYPDQVKRGVDAIVHVHDAPLSVQALAIGPPIAAAPSVVDVDHGKTPAGPVLSAQV